MKCTECGREIGDNLKFCKYCGAPVKVTIAEAMEEEKIKCKACGASIKKGVAFCTQCGTPVDSPDESQKGIKEVKPKKKKKGKLGLILVIIMTLISLLLVGGIVLYFVGDGDIFSRLKKDTQVESSIEDESDSSENESEVGTETEVETESEEASTASAVNDVVEQIAQEITKERDNINKKIVTGAYTSMQVESGITAFMENDDLVEISAGQYSGNNDYSRTYYYVNGTLAYAEYVGTDMHSFYFDADKLVRWSYYQDASNNQNPINYDGENTTSYLQYESNVLNDSVELVRKWISAKQNLNQTQGQTQTGTMTTDQEFIFPNSSNSYLSESDLNGLSEWECLVARNEICARHGCMFKNESLRNHFNSCSWYRGTIDSDSFNKQYNSLTNEIERKNISTIKAYERKKGYNGQ